MAENNPFANLLQTPETLKYERQGRFDALNAGSDFFVRSAGQSGLDLRNRLLEQGRGMTAEDIRAKTTQGIMGNAQKTLAKYVESGELDPMDAQELAISQAVSDFMAVGDYTSAQSLVPQLNGIRQYKAELGKLRSEGLAHESERVRDLTEAATTAAGSPAKIAADVSLAGQRDASARQSDSAVLLNTANARKADRWVPAAPGKGKSNLTPPELRDGRAVATNSISLFNGMSDMLQLIEQSPGVMSGGAGAENVVEQTVVGIQSYFQNRGEHVGGFEGLSDNMAASRDAGKSPKQIVEARQGQIKKMADSLGVDRSLFESMAIDTAYMIARANDPGGRLSNNDFDQALKMLGAVQNPAAARAVFLNLSRRQLSKFDALMEGFGSENADIEFSEQKANVHRRFKQLEERFGTIGAGPSRPVSEAKRSEKNAADRKRYGLE